MTRRKYDFMDSKVKLANLLFWAAVIVMLLLAVGAFVGGCR